MKISDKKLERLIQEAMEREANAIISKINSVPELQDIVAPEEIREKLFEQIREFEEKRCIT